MNAQLDYWMEALNDAASEVDLNITPEQLLVMAKNIEGEHLASPKDWIIKGVQGEFYPCKPDILEGD